MPTHVVRSGDTFIKVATHYGIDDWRVLYQLQDAAFRKRRPNPHLIFPGDRIAIPMGMINKTPLKVQAPCVTTSTKKVLSHVKHGAPLPDAPAKMAKPKARITPEDVRSGNLPDQFTGFLANVLGSKRKDVGDLLEHLTKNRSGHSTDAVQGICELYQSWMHFSEGKQGKGLALMLTGVANVWNASPMKMREPAIRSISGVLRRIPKLGGVADMLRPLDGIGAFPDMMQLLGAIVSGDKHAAAGASGKLIAKMRDNPSVALKLAPDMAKFFADLIPQRLKIKLLAKSGGRKVPVLGTVLVGVTDLLDIWEDPKDLLRWTGLGSTLAGLIPFAGTAISVVLDVGIIIGTIIENLDNINVPVGDVGAHLKQPTG